MWCHDRTRARHDARPGAPLRPTHGPATDEHRRRTQDLLGLATGRGHLGLEDLDARLADVWAATTAAELTRIEASLPADVRAEHDRRVRATRSRDAARAGLRSHLVWYLLVMAVLVATWLTGGLTGGDWYPWPVWPAVFWGMAVAGQARAARATVP
jgi:hypothetical protein